MATTSFQGKMCILRPVGRCLNVVDGSCCEIDYLSFSHNGAEANQWSSGCHRYGSNFWKLLAISRWMQCHTEKPLYLFSLVGCSLLQSPVVCMEDTDWPAKSRYLLSSSETGKSDTNQKQIHCNFSRFSCLMQTTGDPGSLLSTKAITKRF